MLTDEDFRRKFREGMDCSMQMLALASEELYITEEEAYKIGACFGAGMLCGGTCGAITGALMAIGIKHGNYEPNDVEQKSIVNNKRVEFIRRFREAYDGRTTCPDLLGVDLVDPDKRKLAREDGTIERACPGFIRTALAILEELL